jgi:hypothetical protein
MEGSMTKEAKDIITEISLILVRENQITSSEQIRMLELLRSEKTER